MDTKLSLINKLAKLQAKLARYAGKVTRFVRSRIAWLLVLIERLEFAIDVLNNKEDAMRETRIAEIIKYLEECDGNYSCAESKDGKRIYINKWNGRRSNSYGYIAIEENKAGISFSSENIRGWAKHWAELAIKNTH